MAVSQIAAKVESMIGHNDNAETAQDVTNYGTKEKYGDPSVMMKALAWTGKNKVEMSEYFLVM